MKRTAVSLITLIAFTNLALANGGDRTPTEEAEDDQMVLVSASAKLQDLGQLDRVRRVLEQQGMLAKLPERLEATLDGRNVVIAEIEAIRDAYAKLDYKRALDIIQSNEERITANAGSGDMIPALAQLCEWRGLIAAAQEDSDEAIRQFRAAISLNPAWQPDRKLGASPTIRKLVKKARRAPDAMGKLKVDSLVEGATVMVDGKPQPVGERITLPVGLHLVVVTAADHNTYAEIVTINADKQEWIEIELDKASRSDKAAKIVGQTMATPPGKARLKNIKRLQKLTKQTRYLVVENDDSSDNIKFRVYDIDATKVSKPIVLDGSETSSEIASKITAALDPDNMLDPSTIMLVEKERSQRWYERWYVWVGIGAVVGGGILTYQYMSREPDTVKGF